MDADVGVCCARRTAIALDDDLLDEAARLTGTTQQAALVRPGRTALIDRESARRLILLGGTGPAADSGPVDAGPRRRPGR